MDISMKILMAIGSTPIDRIVSQKQYAKQLGVAYLTFRKELQKLESCGLVLSVNVGGRRTKYGINKMNFQKQFSVNSYDILLFDSVNDLKNKYKDFILRKVENLKINIYRGGILKKFVQKFANVPKKMKRGELYYFWGGKELRWDKFYSFVLGDSDKIYKKPERIEFYQNPITEVFHFNFDFGGIEEVSVWDAERIKQFRAIAGTTNLRYLTNKQILYFFKNFDIKEVFAKAIYLVRESVLKGVKNIFAYFKACLVNIEKEDELTIASIEIPVYGDRVSVPRIAEEIDAIQLEFCRHPLLSEAIGYWAREKFGGKLVNWNLFYRTVLGVLNDVKLMYSKTLRKELLCKL